MKQVKFGIYRSTKVTVAVLLGGVVVAACGSASTTSSTATTAGGSAAAASSNNVSASVLSSLQAKVTAAQAVPQFTAPGPAFNGKTAAGKTVVAVPSSSEIPFCAAQTADMVKIGQTIGVPVTNFTATAGQTSWAQAAGQALSSNAGAFTTVCGIDPSSIAPQIASLRAKNIPVIASLGAMTTNIPTTISAGTTVQDPEGVQLLVDDAVVQNQGKPFHALVLTDTSIFGASISAQNAVKQLKSICGSNCPATVQSVPLSEWTTGIESTVSGLLIRDPKITAVFALFDGMVPGFMPAVQGAHRSGLKVYAFGGSVGVVNQIVSTNGVVAADIGSGSNWSAYIQMDQVLRLLSGQPALPVASEGQPMRMWTLSNATDIKSPHPYGTSFVSGFMKLWNLG